MPHKPKNSPSAPLSAQVPGHFNLSDHDAYRAWRQQKLLDYPTDTQALCIDIQNPCSLSNRERTKIQTQLNKTNLVIYKCVGEALTKEGLNALTAQLGLQQLDHNLCADNDKITSLQVRESGRHGGYIPYSDKRLSWHTDGYYNPPAQQVRAIAMHCVRPAYEGGENQYLDPEILYIQLRDTNPSWIDALQHPQAMVIPPNIEKGKLIRDVTPGPVFSVIPSGHLHMRYSARTRNIEWLESEPIKQATAFITDYLNSESDTLFRYRLKANEGVISNNVLHNRTAFKDEVKPGRLLYRARFYERANVIDSNK